MRVSDDVVCTGTTKLATSNYGQRERSIQRTVLDSTRIVLVDSVAPDIVSGPGPGRNPPVFSYPAISGPVPIGFGHRI